MKTKIPSIIKHTCRSCKASRLMDVIKVKRKAASCLTRAQRRKIQWGSRGNQGTYSKSVAKSCKNTKRTAISLLCKVCNKKQPLSRPRTKELEIIKISR